MLVDWNAVLMGFFVGLPVSLLFFAGLALSVRLALRSTRPAGLLLVSALGRIGMLLAVGFWLGAANSWSLAGYALAFFLLRLIVIVRARLAPASATSPAVLEQRNV